MDLTGISFSDASSCFRSIYNQKDRNVTQKGQGIHPEFT